MHQLESEGITNNIGQSYVIVKEPYMAAVDAFGVHKSKDSCTKKMLTAMSVDEIGTARKSITALTTSHRTMCVLETNCEETVRLNDKTPRVAITTT